MTPKFCKDCRSFRPEDQKCEKSRSDSVNLVSGENESHRLLCREYRTNYQPSFCGREAKHFEPKL